MDRFTQAYIECALWSSMDESTPTGGEPLDTNYGVSDLASETLGSFERDCNKFQKENAEDLKQAGNDEQNGHDFWLTRNHHGSGWWDRGYGEVGERLTEATHKYKEVDLYVGDDGKVYA